MGVINLNDQADVSSVLPRVMELSNLTTVKVGEILGYDQSSISKMKAGSMKLKLEDFMRLREHLTPAADAILVLNFVSEITGHLIPSTVDGNLVRVDSYDLTGRVIDEVEQAKIAYKNASDELRSMPDSIHDKSDVIEAFIQNYDVLKFTANLMISFIADYPDIDWQEKVKSRDSRINKFPQRSI